MPKNPKKKRCGGKGDGRKRRKQKRKLKGRKEEGKNGIRLGVKKDPQET